MKMGKYYFSGCTPTLTSKNNSDYKFRIVYINDVDSPESAPEQYFVANQQLTEFSNVLDRLSYGQQVQVGFQKIGNNDAIKSFQPDNVKEKAG